jgi:hypothetical protein
MSGYGSYSFGSDSGSGFFNSGSGGFPFGGSGFQGSSSGGFPFGGPGYQGSGSSGFLFGGSSYRGSDSGNEQFGIPPLINTPLRGWERDSSMLLRPGNLDPERSPLSSRGLLNPIIASRQPWASDLEKDHSSRINDYSQPSPTVFTNVRLFLCPNSLETLD